MLRNDHCLVLTLKTNLSTYQPIAKKAVALLFLMLFLNGMVSESIIASQEDLCQSELIDFEGDKDSEEDTNDDPQKENKILEYQELPGATTDIHLHYVLLYPKRLNGEIQEVLSPPPERC